MCIRDRFTAAPCSSRTRWTSCRTCVPATTSIGRHSVAAGIVGVLELVGRDSASPYDACCGPATGRSTHRHRLRCP
eukprot:5816976-Alexandrium_andersonii.AAC.1